MFSKIMIPVDLAHKEQLEKALAVTASLVRQHNAEAHIVGVTTSAPTPIAKSPEAFAAKLGEYAADISAKHGVTFIAHSEISHDPTIDLDDVLERAAHAIGADLIVMASHVPGFADRIFASNAGYLASHSDLSVFVVR